MDGPCEGGVQLQHVALNVLQRGDSPALQLLPDGLRHPLLGLLRHPLLRLLILQLTFLQTTDSLNFKPSLLLLPVPNDPQIQHIYLAAPLKHTHTHTHTHTQEDRDKPNQLS